MKSTTDRIEKQILLRAPRSRVWRAPTNHQEFVAWFRVSLESGFAVGKTVTGKVTYPGYEHLTFSIKVERMDAERLFSFRWHPAAAVDPKADDLPAGRRGEALRMNSEGWAIQLENVRRHVEG